MKPSAGLIPLTGHFPVVGSRGDGRTVIGPLASSVEMAWRAVVVMAGPDGVDAGVSPVAVGDPDVVDLSTIRVAVGVPNGGQASAATLDALDQTSDVDVIVTPTVPHSAPVHRHMTVDDYLYCLPPSLTGAPAISIPLANGSVQVVARRWEDHVAVAVARKLAFAQSAW